MVIYKKFLELALERLPEIINSLYVSITLVAVFDRDDAVVALDNEWVTRFLLGGLFGAAPSVALATLTLTLFIEGKQYAALEARSMIVGVFAFLLYALVCVYLMAKRHRRAAPTTLAMLVVWGGSASGLWWLFLR